MFTGNEEGPISLACRLVFKGICICLNQMCQRILFLITRHFLCISHLGFFNLFSRVTKNSMNFKFTFLILQYTRTIESFHQSIIIYYFLKISDHWNLQVNCSWVIFLFIHNYILNNQFWIRVFEIERDLLVKIFEKWTNKIVI